MAGLLVCVCVAMWRVFKTGERNEGGCQLCKPAWLWPGVLTHTREELLQAFREAGVCVGRWLWRAFKTGVRNGCGDRLCKPAWLWPGIVTRER